jgi:hypothetical protein
VVAHVFVLALAAAVYPTLLAGVIVLLTRPRPAAQLTAFLVGGMACSLVAGSLVLAALEGSGQFDSSDQAASPALDLAAGVLSLAIGAAVATGRPRRLAERRARKPAPAPAAGPSRTTRVLGGGSLPLIIALGALLNLPGIWYLAALKDISTGGYSTAGDILLVLGFNVVMFTLVELPLLGYLLAPDRTRATVDGFNAWLRAHKRQVAAGVAFAVGAYLVIKGLVEALGS